MEEYKGLEEVRNGLEAWLEDGMKDFRREDWKRLEKEDRELEAKKARKADDGDLQQ